MRQLLWSVSFLLFFAGCGAPSVGSPCTTSDTVTCKSSTEVYACIAGKWAVAVCGGAKGCTDSAAFNCDLSLGTAGNACPPWAEGRTACQAIPPALVSCVGGTWQRNAPCTSCSVANGAPECLNTGTGGGGGTTGGGGGTTGGGGGATGGGGGTTGGGGGATGGGGGTGGGATGGGGGTTCGPGNCSGCCSNGQCFTSPLNGTTNFCGNNGAACDNCGARGMRCDSGSLTCVASTSCNPTTCATGCCTNGQCFTSPLNSTNNFCGIGGAACSDCARLGLVCSAATFTCNPPTGGGAGGGGGATGGGGGGAVTGGGGGATDPCQGVPVGGQCVSSSLVRYCSIPTGNGSASVQTYQCPGGSSCQATGAGAACVQTGSCRANDSRCTSATTVQTCSSSGTWNTAQSCGGGGCVGSSIGGDCVIAVATNTITATLNYQSRSPLPNLSDWAAPVAVPARNVLVLSMRGQQWIDATTTNGAGQYTLKVPSAPGSTDVVVFAAFGGDGLGLRYAVEDPGLGTGTFSPGQQGQNVRYWNWSKPITSLANGGTTTITTAEGSGALNIYDLLQAIWTSSVANNQGRQGMTIGMLMGFGTEWSCGACFSESGSDFETNIWMPGGSQDEGYWSDYTIAHELGHWQMRSYGTSPNEGGSHTLTCPTFPGQAWSEGYATWHSAAVRNQPFLEDKQQGGFFWFDVSSRKYFPFSGSEADITGPGGTNMLAQIDENAVAAMLWTISSSRASGAKEIYNAVSSTHMTTAPWPRGYTRRTWDVGSGCTKTNVVNTGQASLHVADMLDALSCGGSPAQSNRLPLATIQSTTVNGTYYPYPASTPICRAGYCYGCKTGTTCNAGNVATACGTGGVQCVQCGSGQSCVNGVCL